MEWLRGILINILFLQHEQNIYGKECKYTTVIKLYFLEELLQCDL